MEEQKKKDFFISHSSLNKEYAEWIAWTLEEAGYSTMFDSWDFPKGKSFIDCMNDGMIDCEQAIAVASPEYWDANYTDDEWHYFYQLEKEDKKIRVFLVEIRPAAVDPVLRSKLKTILSNIADENEAKNRLLGDLPSDIKKNASQKRNPPKPKPPFPFVKSQISSQNHVCDKKFLYRLGNLNQMDQRDHFYKHISWDICLRNGKAQGFIVAGTQQELPEIIVFTLSHILEDCMEDEYFGETPEITKLASGNWKMYEKRAEEFLWKRFKLTSDIQNIKCLEDRKHQIKAELENKKTCQIFYREIQSDEARNHQFLLDTLLAWSDLDLQEDSPSHFLLLVCETDSLGDAEASVLWKQKLKELLEKQGLHKIMLPHQTSPTMNEDLPNWMKEWDIDLTYREQIIAKFSGNVNMPLMQLKNELCTILKDYPFDKDMSHE